MSIHEHIHLVSNFSRINWNINLPICHFSSRAANVAPKSSDLLLILVNKQFSETPCRTDTSVRASDVVSIWHNYLLHFTEPLFTQRNTFCIHVHLTLSKFHNLMISMLINDPSNITLFICARTLHFLKNKHMFHYKLQRILTVLNYNLQVIWIFHKVVTNSSTKLW